MGKRTGRPPGRPRKGVGDPSLYKEEVPEEWKWDSDRTACLNLTVKGHTNVDISKQLGRHRSTIIAWKQRPEFVERYQEKMGDHVNAVRHRRMHQTTKFADATAKILEKSFKVLADPETKNDPLARDIAADNVKTFGNEFRAWRKEERQDFGDDTKKQQVLIGGHVKHTHMSLHVSMRDFLEQKTENGVISIDHLPNTKDKNLLLTAALEQVLSEPDVADLLSEEDRDEDE